MAKLNQIIAIEKGTKSRVYAVLSEVYKLFQKKDIFNGLTRTYEPVDDDGERFPDESKRVQHKVKDLLETIRENLTEYLDVAAQRDFANCTARANVQVGDFVILRDVPAPHLLFLEKQLNDLKSEIDKLPELDPAHAWKYESQTSLFRADPSKTTKSKKIPKPVTLAEATKEHPAQVQLAAEDKTIGHWTTTPLSGAIPSDEKKQLQKRVNDLIKATKFAREQANETTAPAQSVGKPIFDFVFDGKTPSQDT
jgi:hypothetical protein